MTKLNMIDKISNDLQWIKEYYNKTYPKFIKLDYGFSPSIINMIYMLKDESLNDLENIQRLVEKLNSSLSHFRTDCEDIVNNNKWEEHFKCEGLKMNKSLDNLESYLQWFTKYIYKLCCNPASLPF